MQHVCFKALICSLLTNQLHPWTVGKCWRAESSRCFKRSVALSFLRHVTEVRTPHSTFQCPFLATVVGRHTAGYCVHCFFSTFVCRVGAIMADYHHEWPRVGLNLQSHRAVGVITEEEPSGLFIGCSESSVVSDVYWISQRLTDEETWLWQR